MSDQKQNEQKKSQEQRFSNEEVQKKIVDAQVKMVAGFPKVEFLYNYQQGPHSSFSPSITIKVSGDANYIRELSMKLLPLVEDALEKLEIRNVD